ncbi:MAG: PHP domain-containing protein [Xanthomonadales bacterium]|nr:PHP domain-containing protein [Gammaproteobacteria bacterium]MBT8052352.1 PHP domain-containing protein [Gammaproteobacteria bacterium]NNK52563.1 PHP domain-containing protein [Xanthomonadales bacterium]
MNIDLHSHTACSDGALNPAALIQRAVENGVETLAITDHDTVDAYRDLGPHEESVALIAGIEFSTQWEHTGIHVLGLNIDLDSDAIRTGVRFQSKARLERAQRIGANLEKQGIRDAFDGAARHSAGHYIGRPHFAQYLVESGQVKSMQAAFKKYLGDGKAGDVRQHWADLPQVIQWIRDANGIAVLAHPLKYKMTRTRLKRLLEAFVREGGQGLEVVSGKQLPHQTAGMAQLCAENEMLASCGSDFHEPGRVWAELGRFPPLPGRLTPVWERF